jgi:D-serine dehydratase
MSEVERKSADSRQWNSELIRKTNVDMHEFAASFRCARDCGSKYKKRWQ